MPDLDTPVPSDAEAEKLLLGCLLMDISQMYTAVRIVKGPEYFLGAANAMIYGAMLTVFRTHNRITLDMLQHEITKPADAILEQVGGKSYITELVESVYAPVGVEYYAKRVADVYYRRKMCSVCHDVLMKADGALDTAGFLDTAAQQVFEVACKGRTMADSHRIGDMTEAYYQMVEEGVAPPPGLETGIATLDDMLDGIMPGRLYIMAARPSVGKTAIAVQIASHLAIRKEVPTAFYSLEMTANEIRDRIISAESGVNAKTLRRPDQLSADQAEAIAMTVAATRESPLHITDRDCHRIDQIQGDARRMVGAAGVKILFVDYLQLVSAKGENRNQEVGKVSRELKLMANDLDISVVALCQLNRGSENRNDYRPRLADLRDSGEIEQNADVVMMLHRESLHHLGDQAWLDEHEGNLNDTDLIVNKNRHGEVGNVPLIFRPETTSFNERDRMSGMPRQTWPSASPNGDHKAKLDAALEQVEVDF